MSRRILQITSRLAGRRLIQCAMLCFVLMLVSTGNEMMAQTNEWTWKAGSSSCCQPGVYGTQGTPAAGNIPSSRLQPATATDGQGNFWLFGGWGTNDALLNDLWKFDTSIQEWVWVNGSNTGTTPGVWGTLGAPAAGNIPSPRQNAASWFDSNGNFWILGGYGVDAASNQGLLNDLWEYNPSTSQWAWMAGNKAMTCSQNSDYNKLQCVQPASNGTMGTPGPGNTPGGREGAVTWTDSQGNLWLFGGTSFDPLGTGGYFNDFWEFSTSANEWAWMGGAGVLNCINEPAEGYCVGSQSPQPQYGTLGVAAAGNNPGGRDQAAGWINSSGNLWIFGGTGQIVTGQLDYYIASFDDVWKFNPSTNEWTWMYGNASTTTSVADFPGVYGTLGVSAAGNTPGSRIYENSWTDKADNFWLFGGSGYDSAGTNGYLNDLWVLNPTNLNWTWMGGSTTVGSVCPQGYCGQPAIYGTLGTAAAGDNPGGRAEAAGWTDSAGNFWLFGGGIDHVDIVYNDLWAYQPSATALPPAITPAFNPPAGTYTSAQSVTISNGMTNASIYYTTNGSTPTSSSTLYTGPVSVSTTETLQAIAVASGYPDSGVATAAYAITPPAATPTFSEPGGTYTTAQSVTLSDSTPGATIYYTTDGSTPTTSSTLYSGAITVSATETIQAMATATGYVSSAIASATYTIVPPPDFSLSPINPPSLTVQQGQSGNATVTVTPLNGFSSTVSFSCSGLPAGASCSFSPQTVTPSGSAASTTLTISTASAVASLRTYCFQSFSFALVLTLCGLGWRSKRRRGTRLLLAGCTLGLIVLAGCGTSSTSFTPITSTVTVTASSGSLQHSATLMLTVQ